MYFVCKTNGMFVIALLRSRGDSGDDGKLPQLLLQLPQLVVAVVVGRGNIVVVVHVCWKMICFLCDLSLSSVWSCDFGSWDKQVEASSGAGLARPLMTSSRGEKDWNLNKQKKQNVGMSSKN